MGKGDRRDRTSLGHGLSVSKKGFLMVAIPLFVQLLLLGTVGTMLYWYAIQVENHLHVRNMQDNMATMMKSSIDSGFTMVRYKVKMDPALLVQFDEQMAGVRDSMDRLEAEARPSEMEYIVRIRRDFDKLWQFATDARESMSQESRLEALGSSLHMKKEGGKLITSLQGGIAELESELLHASASENPGRVRHHTTLLLGLIGAASLCACILAFGVHRFFTQSITERLKTLTDNTVRLARSESLHPPDQGSDEIGQLDRVFHDMANALVEAARKERAVIQHALDVICSVDSEGRFTAVSPASLHVWGYSPEELIGRKFFELVAPEHLTDTHFAFARIRDDEIEPQPFETKVIKKDGTFVHILWSAYWANSEQSMFCVAHDITDRKLAEDQLLASEARVRSILETAPVALMVLGNDGAINLMNPRAESMFGYRMEEIIDQPFSVLVPEEQEKFSRETLESHVGRVRELEAKERTGRVFPIEITFAQYRTADGDRYLAAVLDVTERHEVERLKREFVSTVSHELRTPLTAIRGSLTLLAVGALGKLGDQADKAVKIAERNCLRLINLINDLLDIEKLEAGKLEMVFEETSFHPVLERSVESVKAFAEQYAVRIQTTQSDANAKVYADPDRLVQVMVNLLSNAVKYAPRDSVVDVQVDVSGKDVKVSVRDQGRGIPPDFKDKVFERFQQVDSMDSKRKGGTGLGLAICKAIVEQHNGKIGVDSEAGQGSTFWFEIPIHAPVIEGQGARHSASPQLQGDARAVARTLPLQAAAPQLTAVEDSEPTVINIRETNKVAEERG